jgi:hypothetical protein
VGFDKARKQVQRRLVAAVIDLEREMRNIRAFAFRQWAEAEAAFKAHETDTRWRTAESSAFWDWSLLELLVQSGLQLEEASELTTLDILKRHMPDRRVYYMLHVKPSKYDRARVVPIGDGLGRVIAEMIRHVKSFNGTDAVPFCDHWDHHEKRSLPGRPTWCGHPDIQVRWACNAFAVGCGCCRQPRVQGSPMARRRFLLAAACGTWAHICALPTGEHCPRGLVCLGCVHAQPKKNAAPIFRRMLASHERELAAARGRGEPAGQIAARELEVAASAMP